MTWLDIIERLYPIVAGLLGVGLFEIVKFLFFAKSDKKGKEIENDGKEIDNDGKEIDNIGKQVANESKTIDNLIRIIHEVQENYRELKQDFSAYKEEVNNRIVFFKEKFDEIEKERDNFKLATMEANKCPLPAKIEDCPVIHFLRNLHSECSDCQHHKQHKLKND
jgi:hypothetical protein